MKLFKPSVDLKANDFSSDVKAGKFFAQAYGVGLPAL